MPAPLWHILLPLWWAWVWHLAVIPGTWNNHWGCRQSGQRLLRCSADGRRLLWGRPVSRRRPLAPPIFCPLCTDVSMSATSAHSFTITQNKWVPTMICHLVVVMGLKAQKRRKISKIRRREANQKRTSFIWTVTIRFTSARVWGWSTAVMPISILQPFIYGITAVYVIFGYCKFLRMRNGPNWYSLSGGQVKHNWVTRWCNDTIKWLLVWLSIRLLSSDY